jgi:hypothetical protein
MHFCLLLYCVIAAVFVADALLDEHGHTSCRLCEGPTLNAWLVVPCLFAIASIAAVSAAPFDALLNHHGSLTH